MGKNKGGRGKQDNKKQESSKGKEADKVEVPIYHNAIAIDFGDDSCTVGYFSHKENKVVVIQNEDGDFTTPSVLSFTQDEIFVGKPALQHQARNAKNTVYNIKSLLHTPKDTHTTYPFNVTEAGVTVEYKGEQKTFSFQDLIGLVIGKMKSIAEHYLSKQVTRCVITVPRHFEESHREIIINACKDLNMEVLQLLDDPLAAAIAYGLDVAKEVKQGESLDTTAIVVDIGRHSSRVALVRAHKPTGLLEIVSHDTTDDCGGDLMDECIVNHLLQEIQQRFTNAPKDLASNARAMARIRQESEQIKMTLSQTTTANIELDSLFDGVDYQTQVSRVRFEMLIGQALTSLLDLVKKQISAAGTPIDRVLVVGGSAKIPKVTEMIKSLNLETNSDNMLDEAIMSGAARQAYYLRTRIDHLKANNEQPDEQGDRTRASEQVPVTPLSVGVEVNGGLRNVVVPRNVALPYTNTVRFSNTTNSASLLLKIVQGERPFASDNHAVSGTFAVVLAAPVERGTAQVDVTFAVDVTGKLKVTAKDATSGQSLKLAAQPTPAQGEKPTVEDILAAATENTDADKEKVVNAESRLKLEGYVYKMKAQFADNKEVETLSLSTLDWINNNKDKTQQEYLVKLREYHGTLQQILK